MSRKLDAHERNELAAMIQRTSLWEVLGHLAEHVREAGLAGIRLGGTLRGLQMITLADEMQAFNPNKETQT